MRKSVYDADDDGVVDEVEVAPVHSDSHHPGGADIISVEGLYGHLLQTQLSAWAKVSGKPSTFDPANHRSRHQKGGGDQLNCAGLDGRKNFVDRGDPSQNDFTAGDFITDGNPHDLSLALIVPAGATAVHLAYQIKDDLIDKYLLFASTENMNLKNVLRARTQVANIFADIDGIITCDPYRDIVYQASNTTFTSIKVVIKGWFI